MFLLSLKLNEIKLTVTDSALPTPGPAYALLSEPDPLLLFKED